jgi:hypothetical protein
MSHIDSPLAIFTINRLRDLKKHCHGSVISHPDLANFIMWCKSGGAPFLHSAYHRQFVPEHLHLSDSDLAALAANGVGRFGPAAQKTANKVYATFDERRMLSGHLLALKGACAAIGGGVTYCGDRYDSYAFAPDAFPRHHARRHHRS